MTALIAYTLAGVLGLAAAWQVGSLAARRYSRSAAGLLSVALMTVVTLALFHADAGPVQWVAAVFTAFHWIVLVTLETGPEELQ